ncbi:MAG: hypothetical protein RLZZ227_1869 [Pseudomonadota bacterium]|jgi:ribosomal-protein-alanine N-acetyltransferase
MAALSTDVSSALRALEARDIDALISLLPALLPGDWTATGIGRLLEAGHKFRVLVRGDSPEQIAGFAEYQCILDEGHLLGIAVAAQFQRRGIGATLLDDVLMQMRAEGCTRCLLEVRRSNLAAQRLYQQAQFMLDGVRKNYYLPQRAGQASEDALLYSRAI